MSLYFSFTRVHIGIYLYPLQKEAKEGVEKLCGLFPGNYKNECLSYVKTYFDIIWDLLDQEVVSASHQWDDEITKCTVSM